MVDTTQFDLVSPERRLASVAVTAVQIPGADGDMTAMAGHAPTITTLRPGVLSAEGPDGTTDYVVTGGFAEITAVGVTVLAERAMPKSEVTADDMAALIKEAEGALAQAKETFVNEPGPVDDAAKLLADMVAVGDQIRV
ncbi:ATP synthase epsilon chain 1 [Roseobacter cerasinus]|uniref:ATP synthase epsilon chain n=1 Tax=Roseobacter cerasinus TaxID=2602289 RepID=A0A640VWA8_9RHOB|nr:F0F1 ATP synthase subunit epsilon [Roseobacter cerasinus]GFE52177.1 ATP synthase epsilon chain 1 [Roseobacter cerasinus]